MYEYWEENGIGGNNLKFGIWLRIKIKIKKINIILNFTKKYHYILDSAF